MFFFYHCHVLNENEGKSKKYINFLLQFIFFSQNCINYTVSSVSWRINIFSFPVFLRELISYLRKTIFILVQKKGIYAISRKKFLFTEKVIFLMIFCLFHCCHQTINKTHWTWPQYTFFLKQNNKWRVFQRF